MVSTNCYAVVDPPPRRPCLSSISGGKNYNGGKEEEGTRREYIRGVMSPAEGRTRKKTGRKREENIEGLLDGM